MRYMARTNLAKLASSRKVCGFCAIIYQGLYNMKDEWIREWAKHTWADTYSTSDEIEQLSSDRPWLKQFKDEIDGRKDVNEENLLIVLIFPKNCSLLSVHIQLLPWPREMTNTPRGQYRMGHFNRTLAKLDFVAKAGTSIHPCKHKHTQADIAQMHQIGGQASCSVLCRKHNCGMMRL